MEKVKVTIEIPVERLIALQEFLLDLSDKKPEPLKKAKKKEEPVPVPETPAVVAAEPEEKPSVGNVQRTTASADPAGRSDEVTKSDLRAVGVKLTKADREAELKAVFEKYGAKNLGTLDEAHYADVLKELEALV